uniref:Carboxypeptidase n=1 Tax=Panagrellus redivivus TaxID=6233 RepID=A0A7E4UX73_PANRE
MRGALIMIWQHIGVVVLLAVATWQLELSARDNDLVTDLPGLDFKVPFRHYAGYLNVSDTKAFYYNFFEAHENPEFAPLILWLNGGPGCSSMFGSLNENGPFHIKEEGKTLYLNPYAWNRAGNVLYIESPAGVGFSYDTANGNLTDESTADDNHAALEDFFRKFPEYRDHDFYITGESYGGVYVPMLADRVANDTKTFPNFKGIAVGNGVMSFELLYNTLLPFLYHHGLIQERLWINIADKCCNNNTYTCPFYHLQNRDGTQECKDMINEGYHNAETGDDYNLYSACYTDGEPQSRILRSHFAKAAGLPQSKKQDKNGDRPICAQSNNDRQYLNRPDVRRALHVHPDAPTWKECGDVNYHMTRHEVPMFPEFHRLIEKGKRILVYNGDVDTVCNVLLTSKFVEQLGLAAIPDPKNRTFWFHDEEIPNKAGFITRYEKNVDFLTVRGSGHMVPKDKPKEALQMIYNFVYGRDYSEKVVL